MSRLLLANRIGVQASNWLYAGQLLVFILKPLHQRLTLWILTSSVMALSSQAEEVSFKRDVAPILLHRCLSCHNEETREGGYLVTSFAALQRPGESGELPLEGGDEGELLRRLVADDDSERMPAESEPLSSKEIATIRHWLQAGAQFDGKQPDQSLSSILPVTRHPLAPKHYPFAIPISSLTFAGEDVLVGGYHELLRWELSSQTLVQRIPQVGERVYDIVIDGDRLFVASGTPGRLGEVRVLDLKNGTLLGVPLMTTEVIYRLAIHPDGKLLAAGGGDRKIYLIDLNFMTVTKRYDSHSDWVRSLRWSDDGRRLASASRDKTVKLFDPAEDKPMGTYSGHEAEVMDLCFVPGKSDQLISCDASGKVHLWQLNGKPKELKLDANETYCLASHDDGVWISSAASRGGEKVYSATQFSWNGNDRLCNMALPRLAPSIAVDSQTDRIAWGLFDGRAQLLTSQGKDVFGVLPRDSQ